jgi:hypothetical protein
MATKWEQRNQEIASIRDSLRKSPTNLDLADRYLTALGNGRSGKDIIEAYGDAALTSSAGASALARAYRHLFLDSGEAPRRTYINDCLLKALQHHLSELSGEDHANVWWLLQMLGVTAPQSQ